MALSTQPYKGARDFYPEDMRVRQYIFGVMRGAAERFGYEEYDAPLLEPLELYAAKTGEEIVNEQTYTFTDRGGRAVAIRPEMTPTVSRMVAARRQELAYPLRLYSIPNLWRYERPQRGRLREHWQLNVDIFGAPGVEAELELIEVADSIMQTYNAKRDMYIIKINSRKLVDVMLHGYLQLSDVQAYTISKLIDRMHKIDHSEFVAQADALLSPTQRETGASDRLFDLLATKSLSELPDELYRHPSAGQLKQLLNQLHKQGITNAVFDITIMRGFDYYTDIVFEVFDTDPQNNRSMFGGGRYDGLVSMFGVEPVPVVGFGMGDVTIQNFLASHKLLPKLHAKTDLYVIIIGTNDIAERAKAVIAELREMGVNVAVGQQGRKPEKEIKAALKKSIQNVLFIGERELEEAKYMLKNLQTGVEEKHSSQRIVSLVKDFRQNK